jgi:hypothetical protein
MADNDVPLHDAPECFFDAALWNEYLSLHTNREISLAELGRPEPGIIGFHRQEVEKHLGCAQQTLKGWRQARDEALHLRNGLNVHDGRITYRAVADALKLPYTHADDVLRI